MKKILGIILFSLLFHYSSKGSIATDSKELTVKEIETLEKWTMYYEHLEIQEGDTWYNLGKKLNCDYELLMIFNEKIELNIGDIILIPSGVNLMHAYSIDRNFYQRIQDTYNMLYHDEISMMPKD